MNLDVLVFAAHPDDAELSMGGTIAKLSDNGLKVGIIDLTRGELGTRGSAEIRQKEAFKAGIILNIASRENYYMPDGNIEVTRDNVQQIVIAMRKYRPKLVFAPYFNDRHPDHVAVSQLVKKAHFISGLPKVVTFEKDKPQKAYRADKVYYYMQYYEFEPSFIVDISESFETKMQAIQAYSTQFFDKKSVEPETFISQPGFLDYLKSRSQYWGFRIGKSYGEPFYCEEEIELDLIHKIKENITR